MTGEIHAVYVEASNNDVVFGTPENYTTELRHTLYRLRSERLTLLKRLFGE
jgi:hypothetical protein